MIFHENSIWVVKPIVYVKMKSELSFVPNLKDLSKDFHKTRLILDQFQRHLSFYPIKKNRTSFMSNGSLIDNAMVTLTL